MFILELHRVPESQVHSLKKRERNVEAVSKSVRNTTTVNRLVTNTNTTTANTITNSITKTEQGSTLVRNKAVVPKTTTTTTTTHYPVERGQHSKSTQNKAVVQINDSRPVKSVRKNWKFHTIPKVEGYSNDKKSLSKMEQQTVATTLRYPSSIQKSNDQTVYSVTVSPDVVWSPTKIVTGNKLSRKYVLPPTPPVKAPKISNNKNTGLL